MGGKDEGVLLLGAGHLCEPAAGVALAPGPQEEVTVTISPVLPGTDTTAVKAGWQQIGGYGTHPQT